jgi:hypothetical protein
MKTAHNPAFPIEKWGNHNEPTYGLSKREYMSTHILQGMLASKKTYPPGRESSLAAVAVNHADALIEELEKAKS